MQITEVMIKLPDRTERYTKVRAYVSLVIDGALVIHDVRLIDIAGRIEVCMPDRKINDSCPECKAKTFVLARFCERCGHRLGDPEQRRVGREEAGRVYACVAHPINREARREIEDVVLAEYRKAISPAI